MMVFAVWQNQAMIQQADGEAPLRPPLPFMGFMEDGTLCTLKR
jgi:hypothetical protein